MHFVNVKGILSAQGRMNLYRGCTHGCIYCDSRSRCYQMNHDFEDVEVKINAPQLLEAALARKRERCMIGTGSMCDPYMPCEETLGLTRSCLEIINRHGFGLAIQTKSCRILRDMDLLRSINEKTKCVVQMTLTTLDEDLCRIVEPYVSTTRQRFETLCTLRDNGIPTVVWLSPILPFINDTQENLRGILKDCAQAQVRGVICFGMGLTLREGNREYFYQKLDEHFPGLKRRYQLRYGNSYPVVSDNNDALMAFFSRWCQDQDILGDNDLIFHYLHQFPEGMASEQLSLFGEPQP